jgi:predicted amidohydrolase YtcJ
MDTTSEVVEAFCVSGNKFTAVGTLADVKKACGSSKVVNLNGASVIPGLIDSHAHLLYMGFKLARPQFDTCTSVDGDGNSVISVIKKYLAEHALPPGAWLLGFGWDQNQWPDKKFPTKEQLDTILPNNPAFITRIDGHAGWANSAAIKAVPTLPAKDPEGGEIIRDANGQPTGIFTDNAMNLIENHIPKPTVEETDYALSLVLKKCAENGLTAIHNPGIDVNQADLFKRTIDSGNMTLKQYAMWLGVESDLGQAATPATPKIDAYGDLLDVKAVKFFMDGALGSWGAAMIEPYTDRPDLQGYLRMTEEEYHRNVTEWSAAGYQIATHAIGDLANRIVINSYRNICTANQSRVNVPDLRLRIEHFQIVNVSDIEKIHFEGGPGKGSCILASMQPTHAVGDMGFAETRLGPERVKGAYAWEKVLATGAAALPFGSDFPTVGTIPPLLGIYAAVTREDLEQHPTGGWMPTQRVPPLQALKGYTIDAAFAGFQEEQIGSITVGKFADFVALDRDIVTIDPSEIWKATVVGTYVNGDEVFRHACFDSFDDEGRINCPLVDPKTRILRLPGDGCPHGDLPGHRHDHHHHGQGH